ncbi:hypothetical protein EVAR_33365_1 [Eumeta japonica]|uniref:Uncharacterized protein n=1 Tax=Eumeta variegata TaxID=151549 RepID=A0A4C1X2D0_EUMVA|nr:hypothetical protein EVAR_33365_1 [Eumeta japonica]
MSQGIQGTRRTERQARYIVIENLAKGIGSALVSVQRARSLTASVRLSARDAYSGLCTHVMIGERPTPYPRSADVLLNQKLIHTSVTVTVFGEIPPVSGGRAGGCTCAETAIKKIHGARAGPPPATAPPAMYLVRRVVM